MSIRVFFRLLFGAVLGGLAMTALLAGALFFQQRALARSQRVRLDSWMLATELRQSSDDLTRFARTYVATGDPEYEARFWAVLEIRDGRRPRPEGYELPYWDLRLGGGTERHPGRVVPLKVRMQEAGFTKEELACLELAQARSDALVALERQAFQTLRGEGPDPTNGHPDRKRAIQLMHDKAYHEAKAGIMAPIADCFALMEQRTAGDLQVQMRKSDRLMMALMVNLGLLVLLVIGLQVLVQHRVSLPIGALQAQTLEVMEALDRFWNRHRGQLAEPLQPVQDLPGLAGLQRQMLGRLKAAREAVTRLEGEADALMRQVRGSQQSMKGFVFALAQQLSTPILALGRDLRTWSEAHGKHPGETADPALARIEAELDRLGILVETLMRFGRIERATLQPEMVDLTTAAERHLQECQALDPRRRVEVTVAPGLMAKGDAAWLSLCLEQLLDNAWKYTRNTPGAAIEVGQEGPVFYVRDNGPGVLPTELDQLFQPFQRLASAAGIPGQGLGLAMAHRILERHGGQLWASLNAGPGLTFRFTLPG